MKPFRTHLRFSIRTAVVVSLLVVLAASASRAESETLTQRRINEIAARCITARMAMSGMKAAPLPGEEHARFAARIHGYIEALAQLDHELASLREEPVLQDRRPQNLQIWSRTVSSVRALPSDIRAVREAWAAYPKLGPKAQLGPRLFGALSRVEEILNALRDARP